MVYPYSLEKSVVVVKLHQIMSSRSKKIIQLALESTKEDTINGGECNFLTNILIFHDCMIFENFEVMVTE